MLSTKLTSGVFCLPHIHSFSHTPSERQTISSLNGTKAALWMCITMQERKDNAFTEPDGLCWGLKRERERERETCFSGL